MKAHEALLSALLGGTIAGASHGAAVVPETRMPLLNGASAWINSQPLTSAGLRGKVVLVDFWTYTCINWLRTLPWLRTWSEKYADQGLVIIGVHSPEFEFEKDLENVRRAVGDLNVGYPVAVDSDQEIWGAFANQYWPALYFVDAQGRVRHHLFGEGDYERAEEIIQQLLLEAGGSGSWKAIREPRGAGVEAAADWAALRSPETYLGYARTENFASPGGLIPSKHRMYEFPAKLRPNQWALAGDWTAERQAAVASAPGARIAFRFHARDLHLVMGARGDAAQLRFRVTLDGKPPGDAHGLDIDADGFGMLSHRRLYQLIRHDDTVGEQVFEIEFLGAGAEAYAFTFG
jgi:thiol-disulfide isomerase/thioredoxin